VTVLMSGDNCSMECEMVVNCIKIEVVEIGIDDRNLLCA
jgi:hypothetical protein